MANTFGWVEFRTANVERTARFYEGVFGWKVTEKETVDGTPVWIFDTGGEPRLEDLRRGGIWLRPGEEPRLVVYVEVDDIDATLRTVVALGGQVVSPRVPLAGAYLAFFKDPDGLLLGLHEERG